MANKLPSAELLDDLCTRFLLNIPKEDSQSFERLLFLVEQAHWFYEDFCRATDPSLRSLSLRAFTQLIFAQCPGLAGYTRWVDELLRAFAEYKATVPVMGAILLDPAMDKCLLVRGYKDGASWGFPRGKIEKNESDLQCAIREVLEETGFDVSGSIREADCVEVHMGQQRCKLYIVQGVSTDTPFAPSVRYEIGGFAWHSIADLPATKEAAALLYHDHNTGKRHRFFNVHPFVKQLRLWVKRRRREVQQAGARSSSTPPGARAAPGPAASLPLSSVKSLAQSKSFVEPGQAFLNFKFDKEAILRQLAAL